MCNVNFPTFTNPVTVTGMVAAPGVALVIVPAIVTGAVWETECSTDRQINKIRKIRLEFITWILGSRIVEIRNQKASF